jgi:RHS repeat-associated protein
MPSGAKQVKTHDAFGRLTEIKALNGVGTSVNRYAYTYNAAGQREDATLLDGSKISYTYDHKRQLTGAIKNTDSSYVYGYTFDEIGNWLTGQIGRVGQVPLAKTFVPNALNQYTQVSAITQTYDLNGNLTGDGSKTYSYDEDNQLLAVSGGSFTYDGLGRRVVADGVRFLYDEWNVIAELDSANVVTRTVSRGLDLSGDFQGAGGVGGILATTTNTTTGYYFYDGVGNVVTILDGAHATLASYTYDPFGNKVAESGTYASQPYQWSTKAIHSPSGLLYYGYRYYSPSVGRWINRDPIEEAGGFNVYAYTNNNPVNLYDILGHAWGTPNSTITPWELGVEWLTGDGPRHRSFKDGDHFAELMRSHSHIQTLISDATEQARSRCASSCDTASFIIPESAGSYRLSGIQGVGKYLKDYSTLATGGLTGNLAVTFSGSYRAKLTVDQISCCFGTAHILIEINNSSSASSASRPPVIGYTQWWLTNVAPIIDSLFSSGPGSKTTQRVELNEDVQFEPSPDCPE